ncbi:MAG: hypothetical protein U0636_12505 [Phycisphaerales bacterium]
MIHATLLPSLALSLSLLALQTAPPPPTGRPQPTPPPGTSHNTKQPTPRPAGPATPGAPATPAAPAAPATPVTPAPAPKLPPRTQAKVGADGLAAEPLLIEPLGLRFRPPANSVMRTDGAGANAQWTLAERADEPRFVLQIARLTASAEVSSPGKQIADYIKAMNERQSAQEGGAAFTVRDNRTFELGGIPAGIVYGTFKQPGELDATQGYMMLQAGPNELIVFSVLLADSDYTSVAPLLEKSFRTAELLPAETIAQLRAARMTTGQDFLQHLDEDALRTALDPVVKGVPGAAPGQDGPSPRWYRLARRLADGTVQETGYMVVRVMEGPQGAANPDRTPKEWDKPEKEDGMLVMLQTRRLLDEKGTAVADLDARYWVRWDRQREFWTSRATQRQGRVSKTFTQLGVREAPTPRIPRPRLSVADAAPSQPMTPPRTWAIPDQGYVSVAESMVLPRLLARAGGAGEYGFYAFDPRSGRLAQRIDRVERTEDGWRIVSQGTLDAPTSETRTGPRGDLLRFEAEDGSFTEAIEPNALLKLWRDKGLPTGEVK